jgi:predicted Rossmann fold flavoprotein
MSVCSIVVAGGGAAGFFAAITCAETSPRASIVLLERSPRFLSKVRISGGGRCNVTHACFEPGRLRDYYPRGGSELIGAFHRFQPRDTIEWFRSRGVELKTEQDGRVFPVTDSSQTIIDCLISEAEKNRISLRANTGLMSIVSDREGGFELLTSTGDNLRCQRLMLATGGCRAASAGQLAVGLGHTLEEPVPSLFTFHVDLPWLKELAGISVPNVELYSSGFGLRESGPLLITHSGLSGPAVLRLSAWGARPMHGANYRFPIQINWLPDLNAQEIAVVLEECRRKQPARLIVNSPIRPLAGRLWSSLVAAAGIAPLTRWAELSRSARHTLIQQVTHSEFQVTGKTLNQDEFVTCGGVRLSEVNLGTMESRRCPRLYFGGELLDIDGLTGGFNFQSAWTTGWIAGKTMGS